MNNDPITPSPDEVAADTNPLPSPIEETDTLTPEEEAELKRRSALREKHREEMRFQNEFERLCDKRASISHFQILRAIYGEKCTAAELADIWRKTYGVLKKPTQKDLRIEESRRASAQRAIACFKAFDKKQNEAMLMGARAAMVVDAILHNRFRKERTVKTPKKEKGRNKQ